MKKEIEFTDNYYVVKIMIKILNIDTNRTLNLSDLAREIKTSKAGSGFRKAIEILVKEDILLLEKGKYGYEVSIDKNKLLGYLDYQEEINWLVNNFYSRYHKFLW